MAIAAPVAGARILTSDVAAFYNLLKGVTGSGEAITLIYNAAGSLIFQPSSDPATGTELIQIKNNAGTVQLALSSDGKVYAADGTAPLPGLTWEQDKDTGIYRVTANVLGFAAGGSEKMRVDASGVSLDGGTIYLPTETNQWTWTWLPGLAIQSDLTGTGVFTNPVANINSLTQLSTGGTSGSLSGVRKQMRQGATGANGVARVRRWEFSFYSTIDANTNAFVFLTDENTANAPSVTAKHLGIKQVGAVTSFSTADGATEQTTDISAYVTSVNVRMIDVYFDGTTARCYIDGTLRASHATNVPTTAAGVDPEFHATVANTAAASKDLYLGITSARFAF